MCWLPPGTARLLLQGISPAERNNAQDFSLTCRGVCVCVCYSAASLMEEDGQVAQGCVYVCRRGDTLWTSSVKTFSDDWSLERITNSIPPLWQMSPLDKCFRNSPLLWLTASLCNICSFLQCAILCSTDVLNHPLYLDNVFLSGFHLTRTAVLGINSKVIKCSSIPKLTWLSNNRRLFLLKEITTNYKK